jgi:alpha-tubulin suppressor-like RCC1 family protein
VTRRRSARALGTVGTLVAVALGGCGGASPPPTEPTTEPTTGTVPAPSAVADPEGRPADHLLDGVRQVSAGGDHTCALLAQGGVVCWGRNRLGQLGNGRRQNTHTPVRVAALPPARWVSAGRDSTCAITLDDEVLCWGANAVGQLGNGETATGHALPVPAAIGDTLTLDGSEVAARRCGVRTDGTAFCWGELAQLDGTARPVVASETPGIARATDEVVQIQTGGQHECLLRSSGRVACRGFDSDGQLGPAADRAQARFEPVPGVRDVVDLATGDEHTCAVRADGRVYCWGENAQGQLGIGSREDATEPQPVALPSAARHVAAGAHHTCAVSEEGAVHCWGAGASHQLGDGRTDARPAPAPVELPAPAEALSAGARHTCARLRSGELRCWGANEGGQLGDGTFEDRAWPVAVLDPRGAPAP